jgi:hypothetical protein
MLGAIIGDIVGSVYEFRNHRSKVFEPFFHPNAFYTDDTICTVAVADALVTDRHPAQALKDWGCLALFDACPCLAAMKVRPRSVGRRWTKPGGGNRETRRGRSIGAQRYGHLSAARPRRYAMCMVLRHVRRVA